MPKDSVVWKCHPDLEAEWSEFIRESSKTNRSDLNSDLWMNFWRCEQPSIGINSEPADATESWQTHETLSSQHLGSDAPSTLKAFDTTSEEFEVRALPLTESQSLQTKSIALELLDILDIDSESIPDELQKDISSLTPDAFSFLLAELRPQLSDQGAYNFCSLLCADSEPWTRISLVLQVLFLPMLSGHALRPLGEEVKAGLKQLTVHFPSECVLHLLKPLLAKEPATPFYLELLSGLIPSLPEKDSLCLLRYFINQCEAPIEEWKILALSCILSSFKAGALESKPESPLTDLLPVLSSSARALSASESFACLLLKVIPTFKFSASPRVQSELTGIVQQNKSFNKQALMNAIKALGS